MIKGKYFELFFWIFALVLLAMANPNEHHFTLCPLANLGIDWCPGCGLGRSISALFHANIDESLRYHWFGIPALALILYRIYRLTTVLIIKRKTYIDLKY